MNDAIKAGQSAKAVEDMLRDELAQGDVVLSTATPILRHLLANDDHALFNDEVIATIRGMMVHLGRQMLFKLAEELKTDDRSEFVSQYQDALATALLQDTAFLGHAHALAVEAQLTERLQSRSGVDPVLTPLLQELTASTTQAADAMRVVASQARFMQHQRRMELPLDELPAELFHGATKALKNNLPDYATETKSVCDRLRADYREGERRVGQMTKLVLTLGSDGNRALSIANAGLSFFATALHMVAAQDRDLVVLSLGENQCARLALSLRAAGLDQGEVEEQFIYLHPETTLPDGFDALQADQAAQLLHSAAAKQVH
ncbi:MAG: hypothetical protein WA957_17225 [Alteraurantiacibacter sp.]